MQAKLKNFYRIFFIMVLTSMLQACGGSSDDTPKYTISADVSAAHFSNPLGEVSSDSLTVNVTFSGSGVALGYAPGEAPVPWLNMRSETVTATTARIVIDIVNADRFAASLYDTTIRVSTADENGANLVNHDIKISLLIWSQLSFGDTFGVEAIESKTYSFSNNTNSWTATSDVDWLTLSSETVEGITTVSITPALASLTAAGLYQGNIVLTDSVSNKQQKVPVELGLDNLYLYTNVPTLMLTSTLNINATEQIINVKSNALTPIKWQATTDAPWLILTPIEGSDQLKVTADKSLTDANSLSSAVIAISATENDTVITKNLAVNFYNSPDATPTTTLEELVVNNNALVSAPDKPFIYVGINNELRVYHQYTGELISTTVVSLEGTLLEQFIVHPEGNTLIARAIETIVNDIEDETDNELITHRYNINLQDLTFTKIENATTQYEPLSFVSFYGRHFVVTQVVEFADDMLQRTYWDAANAFFARSANQVRDKDVLYLLEGNTSTLKRLTATVNDFTTASITSTVSHEYRPENLADNEFIADFVVNNDESNIYTISPTSEWISFDGETFTDNGLLETTEGIITLALDKSSNGRPHYIRINPDIGYIVDVYDENQLLTTSIKTAGNQPTNVSLSADNKRLAIDAGNNDQIELINLTQFNVSATDLAFNTTFGDNAIDSQTVTLTGVGDGWQATSDAAWLVVSQDNSGDIASLIASIDTSQITGWGLLTGTITVIDPASGTTTVIVVKLAIDAVRVTSSYPSLSFNSLATQEKLVHTVDIIINSEADIVWQATADVSWVNITADNANNKLTITALPSAVAANDIHYGKITLAAVTDGEALSSDIMISLNKDSADAVDVTIANITANTSGTVVDNYRPYIYVAVLDSIRVYNVITGTLVTTIQSPLADVNLTNLVAHPDGSLLLASNLETYLDENDVEQTRINHYQVDLATQAISQINAENIDIGYRPIAINVINGLPVVITQTLEFADLSLKTQYWDDENAYFVSTFGHAVTTNTFTALKATDTALNPYAINVNAYAEKTITAELTTPYINSNLTGATAALALSSDGKDIYATSNNTEWVTFDGDSTYTDKGLLDAKATVTPRNVMIDSDNSSYFYRFDQSLGFVASKYDSDQALVWAKTIAANGTSNESYIMPNFQRIAVFNSATNSLHIINLP